MFYNLSGKAKKSYGYGNIMHKRRTRMKVWNCILPTLFNKKSTGSFAPNRSLDANDEVGAVTTPVQKWCMVRGQMQGHNEVTGQVQRRNNVKGQLYGQTRSSLSI